MLFFFFPYSITVLFIMCATNYGEMKVFKSYTTKRRHFLSRNTLRKTVCMVYPIRMMFFIFLFRRVLDLQERYTGV